MDKIGHALSSDEITAVLNFYGIEAPVLLYSDVFDADTNIKDFLLKQPNHSAIILFRSAESYGHWIAIFLNNALDLYIYDSIGECLPDDWGRRLPKNLAKDLGQDKKYLIKSALNSGFNQIFYNDYDIQNPSPEVQTCGRHCIVRLMRRDLTPKKYYDALGKVCGFDPSIKNTPIKYDFLVTALTDVLSSTNRPRALELYKHLIEI